MDDYGTPCADLKWATFKTLHQLQTHVAQLLNELTVYDCFPLAGYPFILDAPSAQNRLN